MISLSLTGLSISPKTLYFWGVIHVCFLINLGHISISYFMHWNSSLFIASISVSSNKNNTMYKVGSVSTLKVDDDSTIQCEKSESLKSTVSDFKRCWILI